jgi:hypothetical protein
MIKRNTKINNDNNLNMETVMFPHGSRILTNYSIAYAVQNVAFSSNQDK